MRTQTVIDRPDARNRSPLWMLVPWALGLAVIVVAAALKYGILPIALLLVVLALAFRREYRTGRLDS